MEGLKNLLTQLQQNPQKKEEIANALAQQMDPPPLDQMPQFQVPQVAPKPQQVAPEQPASLGQFL